MFAAPKDPLSPSNVIFLKVVPLRIKNMFAVKYPDAGLTVGFLNSSPTILHPAGTLIGSISLYTPDFTKIVPGALWA